MINEITVNSNNAIELSRSQLLSWINQLLGTSINKIQQLGTGAFYCQMLDLLYPGKVQLSKVNFKAKNQYEYINNFKLLQQYFTKFGIIKNIEVEKLIKCKYQDNLEFLQWFKKIFDNHYCSPQQSSISVKRPSSQNDTQLSLEKENKKPPTKALNFSVTQSDKGVNQMPKLQFIKQGAQKSMHSSTSRSKIDEKSKKQTSFIIKPSTERINNISDRFTTNQKQELQKYEKMNQNLIESSALNQKNKHQYYSPSKYIEKENFFKQAVDGNVLAKEERQFYLKKFKEIEHLLEVHQTNEHCQKLIDSIRKVILLPPSATDWSIEQLTGQILLPKQSLAPTSQFKDLSPNLEKINCL